MACLESFLKPYNSSFTQEIFIRDFPELTHAGTEEEGKIHTSQLGTLGLKYNFKVEEADTEKQNKINTDTLVRLFNLLEDNQTIFIATRRLYRDGVLGDYFHCLRFLRLDGEDVFVMDPTKDTEQKHPINHILDYRPIILKLTFNEQSKSA